MKVVAINGSPKMDQGNTALILNPFLEGMKEADAEVELFYTRKLKVAPCQGEFDCVLKTPGICFLKDDMQALIPKLGDADVWVLASPVYTCGLTAPLKNILDRLSPLQLPFFHILDGHSFHPRREGTRRNKVVLVSNCGFWEMDNFDALLAQIKDLCKISDRIFAGALLRPHGGGLRQMQESGMLMDDIFEAARDAGRQLVEDGEMFQTTLKIISRELIPMEDLYKSTNHAVEQMLDNL
jgi:multimeric flavodoxin WrbA